jgi:hypothetical protein
MTGSNEIIDWWQWRSIYMPKEKLPEVRAIDILAQIQRGERVEHDHVVITGNLGPLTSEMHTVRVGLISVRLHITSSPIIITNSFIQGKVTLEEILFNEAVDFRGTTFEKEVSFMGSIFHQQCIFECAHFLEAIHFSDMKRCKPEEDKHARFFGQSNFKQTVFEKYVDFSKVEFEQSAEFGSQIPEESIKSKSIFKGSDTYFVGAKFKLLAHFEECEFINSTYFTGAIFSREAYFNKATFGSHTDFRLVNFNENTYFNNASFSGGVGFAESTFKNNADFRKVSFNGDYGNFRATRFSGEFVSFRNAKFRNLCDQAVACKKARKQLEDSGSRGEADHNFFMEMEAKRRQKGITKVNNNTSRLALQPTLKLSSEFFDDLIKEDLSWKERLLTIFQFLRYNVVGAKELVSKFYGDLNKEGLSWKERLSIIYCFLWHNLFEFIIFRHLFGGYGIFWQSIFLWWLFFAVLFGLFYRYYFNGIGDASCLSQCIYFSILVAFTKGLGNYQLSLNTITLEDKVITFESILGLMMFALFFASITRRYMR